ncbi:hypothetical protein L0U88_10985 [Flavihumibacter sp. RY-1]|jgi:hypothetical protein|uniref:Immunity protein 19 of polymorphic toxin system n=1 Tax=Flavihumibacter fluminis TaxID=2909236 RepID=A0ABS9BJY4_9BACT|nr:hypothetical protein [Flavihumibacter fluminis]MCF1715149.1 hypothetical protein [Flavihumibacter fluminis]
MKISCIFRKKDREFLWAINEKKGKKDIDVFSKLLEDFTNTEYLYEFFKKNQDLLNTPFWEGITIDKAIEKVLDEIYSIELELYSIVNQLPGYQHSSLSDVFVPLHENIYSLNFTNENFRKGKANVLKPMIRLYAIELEDGIFIITGGAIKLSQKMDGPNFEYEINKLNSLKKFLKQENIIDKDSLIDYLNNQ